MIITRANIPPPPDRTCVPSCPYNLALNPFHLFCRSLRMYSSESAGARFHRGRPSSRDRTHVMLIIVTKCPPYALIRRVPCSRSWRRWLITVIIVGNLEIIVVENTVVTDTRSLLRDISICTCPRLLLIAHHEICNVQGCAHEHGNLEYQQRNGCRGVLRRRGEGTTKEPCGEYTTRISHDKINCKGGRAADVWRGIVCYPGLERRCGTVCSWQKQEDCTVTNVTVIRPCNEIAGSKCDQWIKLTIDIKRIPRNIAKPAIVQTAHARLVSPRHP